MNGFTSVICWNWKVLSKFYVLFWQCSFKHYAGVIEMVYPNATFIVISVLLSKLHLKRLCFNWKTIELYCKIAPLLKIILPVLEIDDSKHETKMPSIPNILIFFFSPHITTLHDSPTVVEEQNWTNEDLHYKQLCCQWSVGWPIRCCLLLMLTNL